MNIQKKKFRKKKKSILYICGGYPNYEMELLSIKYLISFCTKYSYKLFILSKNDKKKDKMLIKKYGYMNLKIINNKKRIQNYEVMSKFSIIVFHYSTLGYEAISRGLKAISVGHKSFYSIKNNGPFWCSFNYKSIERLIIRVLKLPYFKWSKTHKKYSYNFMDYDPNNYKRKKIINNCLFSKQLT